MIKQYVVTVEYPDHYIPVEISDINAALWGYLSILPRDKVRVVEGAGMDDVVKNVIRLIDLCDKHSAQVKAMSFKEYLEKEPSACRMCMRERINSHSNAMLHAAIFIGYLRALFYLRLPHGETIQDICFREDYKLHDAIGAAILGWGNQGKIENSEISPLGKVGKENEGGV